MTDLRLFKVDGPSAQEIVATTRPLERDLQLYLESNLLIVFGVSFIASEYSTGAVHRGRIDFTRLG